MNKYVVVLTAMLALFPAVVLAQSDPQGSAPAVGLSSTSAPAACGQYDVTTRGCETRPPLESTGGGQQMNLAAQDAARDSQVAADTLSGGAGRSEDETGGAAFAAEPRDGEIPDEDMGLGTSHSDSVSNEGVGDEIGTRGSSSAGVSKVSDDAEEDLAVASTEASVAASAESSASASTGVKHSSRDATTVKITRLPDSGGFPVAALLPFVLGAPFLTVWALLRSVGG